MSPTILSCAALLLALVPAPVAVAADLAFAHDFLAGERQVTTFPVGSPATMTVLGPQAASFTGMDFDPGGTVLWAVNFTTQTLGIIDQATGAYMPSVALQDPCCITAFTIDPVGGKFYVARGDEFVYELSPASGTTVLLARASAVATQINALAFDCTGRLFAADGADGGSLYLVNLAGNPVAVGAPQFSRTTSLEFDNRTGILYGWFSPAGGTTSTHGTVDPATAQVSQTTVLAGRYRMAIRDSCSPAQLRLFADGFEG